MIFLLTSCSNESATSSNYETQQWMVYEGGDGPGKGKHVVFISGDEEYRSEEALPQLAKIFSKHHGFKSTVLFSINKKSFSDSPVSNSGSCPLMIERAAFTVLLK